MKTILLLLIPLTVFAGEVDYEEIGTRLTTERLTSNQKEELLSEPATQLRGTELTQYWNFVLRGLERFKLDRQANERLFGQAMSHLGNMPPMGNDHGISPNDDFVSALVGIAASPTLISEIQAKNAFNALFVSPALTSNMLWYILAHHTYWSDAGSRYPFRLEMLERMLRSPIADADLHVKTLEALVEARGIRPGSRSSLSKTSRLSYQELERLMGVLIAFGRLEPDSAKTAGLYREAFTIGKIFRKDLALRIDPWGLVMRNIEEHGIRFAIALNEWLEEDEVLSDRAVIYARSFAETAMEARDVHSLPVERDILRVLAIRYDLGEDLQLEVLKFVSSSARSMFSTLYDVRESGRIPAKTVQRLMERAIDMAETSKVDRSNPNALTWDSVISLMVLDPIERCSTAADSATCSSGLDVASICRRIAGNTNISVELRNRAHKLPRKLQ